MKRSCVRCAELAELAVSEVDESSRLGVAELNALNDSDLLGESQQLFIDAALESVIHEVSEEIEEIEAAGDVAEVVELDAEDGEGNKD